MLYSCILLNRAGSYGCCLSLLLINIPCPLATSWPTSQFFMLSHPDHFPLPKQKSSSPVPRVPCSSSCSLLQLLDCVFISWPYVMQLSHMSLVIPVYLFSFIIFDPQAPTPCLFLCSTDCPCTGLVSLSLNYPVSLNLHIVSSRFGSTNTPYSPYSASISTFTDLPQHFEKSEPWGLNLALAHSKILFHHEEFW